ncbi:uncharacterized protein PG986_007774 [Apiospora aurea]|uniref:Uncharacterized protein n=1 Tax=Apiospora aurea TaxID=335848 RepID=A0ABR1QDI4_9PEZI
MSMLSTPERSSSTLASAMRRSGAWDAAEIRAGEKDEKSEKRPGLACVVRSPQLQALILINTTEEPSSSTSDGMRPKPKSPFRRNCSPTSNGLPSHLLS